MYNFSQWQHMLDKKHPTSSHICQLMIIAWKLPWIIHAPNWSVYPFLLLIWKICFFISYLFCIFLSVRCLPLKSPSYVIRLHVNFGTYCQLMQLSYATIPRSKDQRVLKPPLYLSIMQKFHRNPARISKSIIHSLASTVIITSISV